jgi:electron transport complex protein RnfB
MDVCPVDAIVGAHKFLHAILPEQCIGCRLCVAPCPMDCITMITVPEPPPEEKRVKAEKTKIRYLSRQQRLALQRKVQLAPLQGTSKETMAAAISKAQQPRH